MRRIRLLMAVVGLSISLIFSAGIVQAATITVGGACTLILAIQEANTIGASGGACVAGAAGADTIVLAAATTYNLATSPYVADGNNALPNITSNITINGNGATITRTGAGTYRLFHVAAIGNLTLNNVTISNGAEDTGAGIYNLGALTITSSTITNNTAAGDGGGIYHEGNSLIISGGSVFSGNHAIANDGGGILSVRGTVSIDNTRFTGNSSFRGAGLYTCTCEDAGQTTISNSQFTNNQVAAYGGAIQMNGGVNTMAVTITGTTIANNTAGVGGGAIMTGGSGVNQNGMQLTIDSSTIQNNTAADRGGAIYASPFSQITIQNGTRLIGNHAITTNGGGIYNFRSTLTILPGSLLQNNRAVNGGAIFNDAAPSSQVTVNGACIEGNTATSVFSAGDVINATGNWWNAVSGPSGAGPGTGDSVNASVNFAGFLTASPPGCNQPPVANNDAATTPQGAAVGVNVLANDTDADGTLNPATVTVVGAPANGTTGVNPATGAVTYTPNPAFVGPTDTFTYTVQDDDGATSNVATVTITITTAPNQAPVANNDIAATPQGLAVIVSVLANDTDADGTLNPATVAVVGAPANGTTAVNTITGAIMYTPNPAFAGPNDTFTYTVQDDDAATSNVATVTVAISSVVVPPAATVSAASSLPIDLRPVACSDLNTQAVSNLRVNVPGGTVTNGDVYCRVIVRDNLYIQDSSEIGRQTVIDLGIIQAVDLFGLRTGGESVPDFNNAIEVCLSGSGSLLYLNALAAPRVLQPVFSVTEGGYTCAEIPDAGTVVLITGATNAPTASVTELQNCRVTTTHAVRLRIEPDTSSSIITTLPYDLTLTATERQGNWFRVIYLDGQGWVSGDYLHTAGTCAD